MRASKEGASDITVTAALSQATCPVPIFSQLRSQDSVVGTVTARDPIPGRNKGFSLFLKSPDQLWEQPSFPFYGRGPFNRG